MPKKPPPGDRGGKLGPDRPRDRSTELPNIVGANLKRLRVRHGHSLERLARLSGVSRAMLGQIETGKSVPTISLLWKVATALGVPVSNLLVAPDALGTVVLPKDRAKLLISSNGRFISRALFPFGAERRVEFYEVRIAGLHREREEAHPAGTKGNLVVVRGTVEIVVDKERPSVLGEGDAVVFNADVVHAYRNLGAEEAILYLVMSYVESVGK